MSLIIRGEPSRFGLTAHLETSSLCNAVGRNPGNLAFSYATSLILQFPLHCNHTAPIQNGESIAVYTLANYLGSHYDPTTFSQFLDKAPKEWKMMAVGLGAQGPLDRLSFDLDDALIHKGHLDWLRLMMERSPTGGANVALRGEFTYQILEKYGLANGAVVTGCPSFMLSPLKDLGQRIFNKFTAIDKRPLIHGALGNPWNPVHRSFEQALLQLIVSTDGVAHVQMLEDHIALARGDTLSEATMRTLHKQLAPHLMIDDLRDFGRRYLRVWWDVPSWMEDLLRADFLFGSRIHGVMLALQAGTPAMCAIWDSRTHELCKTMGVPHVSIYDEPWASGNFNWNDIRTEFERQFDPSSFDRLRHQRAIQFRDLFINNGVKISPHLHNLAT
jgi:hypothetical protein